jgi:hypothetical protein
MKKKYFTEEEKKAAKKRYAQTDYKKHKEHIDKKNMEYHWKNREERLKKMKEYQLKNKDAIIKYRKKRYHEVIKKNPELMQKHRESVRRCKERYRQKCIEYYSKGKNCCELCGISDIDVLTIDHKNGGGRQERKKLSNHVEKYLVKNNFPEGYRILCMNCNMKEARQKGYYGTRL